MNVYNLTNLEAQIKDFLIAGNISAVSVRNYISDFRFFYGWYINIYHGEPALNSLDEATLLQYKRFLSEGNLPLKTVNRRLSGMRKLCDCLRKMNLLSAYPEEAISNLSSLQVVTELDHEAKDKLLSEYKYNLLLSTKGKAQVSKQIDDIKDLLNSISIE